MFEIFVLFRWCLCCFLPGFVNRQPPCPHTNSCHVLLHPQMHIDPSFEGLRGATENLVIWPDATQKPLVRKRACSGGANWVQVTRQMSPGTAKRPRTAGLQQPGGTHKKHQILSTAEAASFASQFAGGGNKSDPHFSAFFRIFFRIFSPARLCLPKWRCIVRLCLFTGSIHSVTRSIQFPCV